MPALRDKTIAIVGGGTMGSAIALGLVRTGSLEPQRVLVADPCQDRRDHLASEGIQVFDAASSMGATSPDVVIIAVKPQVLPDVVKKASDLLGGEARDLDRGRRQAPGTRVPHARIAHYPCDA